MAVGGGGEGRKPPNVPHDPPAASDSKKRCPQEGHGLDATIVRSGAPDLRFPPEQTREREASTDAMTTPQGNNARRHRRCQLRPKPGASFCSAPARRHPPVSWTTFGPLVAGQPDCPWGPHPRRWPCVTAHGGPQPRAAARRRDDEDLLPQPLDPRDQPQPPPGWPPTPPWCPAASAHGRCHGLQARPDPDGPRAGTRAPREAAPPPCSPSRAWACLRCTSPPSHRRHTRRRGQRRKMPLRVGKRPPPLPSPPMLRPADPPAAAGGESVGAARVRRVRRGRGVSVQTIN